MKKKANIIIVLITLCSLVIVGLISWWLLTSQSSNSLKIANISILLNPKNYKGRILRNKNNPFNLTKKLKEFKNGFNGWTTNNVFSRILNSVELRNNDSLVVQMPSNKIENWGSYVRWIDTLSIESELNKQAIKFKKISTNMWMSQPYIAYSFPKNFPVKIWNRKNSCFSQSFYNSLNEHDKQSISKTLTYNKNFFLKHTNNRVKELKDLNSIEWISVDKNGNGFSCYQKIKQGAILVKKINSNNLLFTFNGWSDYSFIEKNLFLKYTMGYSFMQIRDANLVSSKWYFGSGLLFSNLDQIYNSSSNALTYFSKSFRKNTPGIFSVYNKIKGYDVDSSYKNAINAIFKKEKKNPNSFFCLKIKICENNVKMFKQIDETFAGLYIDGRPHHFSKWYLM